MEHRFSFSFFFFPPSIKKKMGVNGGEKVMGKAKNELSLGRFPS
jgi:hypothetical protein